MSHKRHISFLLIWPQGSQVYQKMLRHPLNSLEVLCAKIEPKLFFENSSILTNLSAPNLQIPPVTPGDLPKVGKKNSVQKATVAMPTWENLNVCTSPDSNVLMQDQWSLYLIENGCCGYVSGNLLSIHKSFFKLTAFPQAWHITFSN